MALLASSIEQLAAYNRASDRLRSLAMVFEKAATFMDEARLYEEVNRLKRRAVEIHGQQCVDALEKSVRKKLKQEIITQGTDMTSLTCMWFTVASAFARHSADDYTDSHAD
jgi:hypothetical protein